MARYDGTYDRGFGFGGRRPRIWGRGEAYFEHGGGGYDRDMTPGQNWARGEHGFGGQYGGRGQFQGGGGGQMRGGYDRGFPRDRGVYGGGYPEYGGIPGSRREGMHYGGQGGGAMQRPNPGRQWPGTGYDAGYRGDYGRGYDRGMGRGGMNRPPYGADFAREPFMPEAAYLRHPEYETPSTYHQNRWERPGEYVVDRAEPLSDEEIRTEVRQRLFQDTWLHADDIEVTVRQGVVTLRGDVNDFLEARYAWDDAWETEGVRGVINNLTVRPDEPGAEHHGDMFSQETTVTEGGNG